MYLHEFVNVFVSKHAVDVTVSFHSNISIMEVSNKTDVIHSLLVFNTLASCSIVRHLSL